MTPTPSDTLDIYQRSRVTLRDAAAMDELRADIVRAACLPGNDGAGAFLDRYLVMARPGIVRRLCRFMSAKLPPATDRIVAASPEALALTAPISLQSGLPLGVVRQAGGDTTIEGGVDGGDIVVVDDVVTTGADVVGAITRLRALDMSVTTVLAAVDCALGAAEQLARLNVDYLPLITYSSLRDARRTHALG